MQMKDEDAEENEEDDSLYIRYKHRGTDDNVCKGFDIDTEKELIVTMKAINGKADFAIERH